LTVDEIMENLADNDKVSRFEYEQYGAPDTTISEHKSNN